MSWYEDYKPYVPVAQRRAEAAREVARRLKKGEEICPVQIEGRKITTTFWGNSWCENLESYSDFANRLPRGRTYARNGSILHLAIERGMVHALVSGSSVYKVTIEIKPLPSTQWIALKQRCANQVGSLVELLQGKLSQAVMALVTDRKTGLFPQPREIEMRCSCPDYAGMCKHVAAVMYGIGHRLDLAPELLFQLRGVDQAELINQAIPNATTRTEGKAPRIAAADLGGIFNIEIDAEPTRAAPSPRASQPDQGKKSAPVAQAPAQVTAGLPQQPTTRSRSQKEPTMPSPKKAVTPAAKPQPKSEPVVPAAAKAPAAKVSKPKKVTPPAAVVPPPEAATPAPVKFPAIRALINPAPLTRKKPQG